LHSAKASAVRVANEHLHNKEGGSRL
jgi:hypothetical protein